jgi:hypothetical protein
VTLNGLRFLCAILGIFIWAWCMAVSWAWFAPVVSPALPILTLGQCIVIRAMRPFFQIFPSMPKDFCEKDKSKEPDKTESLRKAIWNVMLNVVVPFVILGINWIVHLFIYAPVEAK